MKIVLPYVGSKKRLFHTLKGVVPVHNLYIEPFAGGYSLGLNFIKHKHVTQTLLNDADPQVTDFWSAVKEDHWGLVTAIDHLIILYNLHAHEDPLSIKEKLDKTAVDKITASALYYIYRKMNIGAQRSVTSKGVSFGDLTYTEIFQEASSLLTNTTITNKSYEDLKIHDSPNTFWYLDPPYYDAQNSHYYTICKDDFNHEQLMNFCKDLKGKFIQSNTDCKEIHEIYKDFYIYPIKVPSSLNLKGYSEEVLISNYPLEMELENGYAETRNLRASRVYYEHSPTLGELLNEDEDQL